MPCAYQVVWLDPPNRSSDTSDVRRAVKPGISELIDMIVVFITISLLKVT